jgi:hypothetical protein
LLAGYAGAEDLDGEAHVSSLLDDLAHRLAHKRGHGDALA